MDINAEQFDKKERMKEYGKKDGNLEKEIEKFWKWLDGKELFC